MDKLKNYLNNFKIIIKKKLEIATKITTMKNIYYY